MLEDHIIGDQTGGFGSEAAFLQIAQGAKSFMRIIKKGNQYFFHIYCPVYTLNPNSP